MISIPFNIDEIIAGIQLGDRFALSRGITLMESNLSAHQPLQVKLISECLSHSSKSIRVGISGAPGVGKSTFIDYLGNYLIKLGHRIAVLAIDPSSSASGGSILGDKTRMKSLIDVEQVYIRPSPNAMHLGGVAKSTFESAILCEAAGFNIILIETVGVGQAEIEARDLVDIFLLLLQPGAGDDLQGIKKGIVEIADLLIVHKADGLLAESAKNSAQMYREAIKVLPDAISRNIQVLRASSLEQKGMDRIWSQILTIYEKKEIDEFRKKQMLHWFEEQIKCKLVDQAFDRFNELLSATEAAILKGEKNYYQAAEDVLKILTDKWK